MGPKKRIIQNNRRLDLKDNRRQRVVKNNSGLAMICNTLLIVFIPLLFGFTFKSKFRDEIRSDESISKKASLGNAVLYRHEYRKMDERPQASHIRMANAARESIDRTIDHRRILVDKNPQDIESLVVLANNLLDRNIFFNEASVDNDEIFWCYEHALQVLHSLMTLPESSIDGIKQNHCAIASFYISALQESDLYNESLEIFEEVSLSFCSQEYLKQIIEKSGKSYLVLGRYHEAGKAFKTVYNIDPSYFLTSTSKHLNKLMATNSDAFPGGWDACIKIINQHLPIETSKYDTASIEEIKEQAAKSLQKMHLLLFTYFDHEGDASSAWTHLEMSQKFKAYYTTTHWNDEFLYLERIKKMFNSFSLKRVKGSGIETRVPIFLVGFPRSGTTLLERILDAHPSIAGLGETSALSANIDGMRKELSSLTSTDKILEVIEETAKKVLSGMELRWDRIIANRKRSGESIEPTKEKPLRFVDKLNTNHRILGYIHILFPNALIIHCARNPIDAVFSSFKHDFNGMSELNILQTNMVFSKSCIFHIKVEKPGQDKAVQNIDNYSTLESVSKMYESFREIMHYYDHILPGRIIHVRYEELVEDFEGVARVIIKATGLEWDDEILDFHKKKQAVNTFSSTQVRKKLNKSGIDAWKKYKTYLQPLIDMLGKYVTYDISTSNYNALYDATL